MCEFHSVYEHSELDAALADLETAIPLAVKKQSENGDTRGALNSLTPIINQAIAMDTPENSRASVSRAYVLEQAFDKARLIYQRAHQPHQAVASGMVSYFMGIKRMAAGADYGVARAAALRSPEYINKPWIDEEDRKAIEIEALNEINDSKELFADACAAITDIFILDEATRLLKKQKLDVAIAQNILSVVSRPPDNPWELFNAVMSSFGR